MPLQVVVGGRSLAEGVEVSSGEVAAALREWRPVTTSRPAPQTFVDAYRRLGVPEIVSVHLSADLSGTVDAARLAAAQVADEGITVVVVDSRSLGMGLGHTARVAAAAVGQGADAEAAARVARRYALEVGIWLYVDTLEYLRRGGRVGAAAAMLGSALAVKPLLTSPTAGSSWSSGSGRRGRALARLEELAVARRATPPSTSPSSTSPLPERAQEMAERLQRRVPQVRSMTSGRSAPSSGRMSARGCSASW